MMDRGFPPARPGLARRSMLLALAALPAACASPNPVLYVLAPVPGAVTAGGPRIVAVRAVSLAHYLERSQIVRSSDGYRLDVLGNEWWGEPLDALLNRILVQDLAQRLPGSQVYADNGAISATPDATIEVNIERFDLDRSNAARLLANVSIGGRGTLLRTVSLGVTPTDASTGGLVAALSAVTGQLADAIATMLAGAG